VFIVLCRYNNITGAQHLFDLSKYMKNICLLRVWFEEHLDCFCIYLFLMLSLDIMMTVFIIHVLLYH